MRGCTLEQLKADYDLLAQHTVEGLGFIRDEIFRREVEAQQTRMERMTAAIQRLTWTITVLTVVNTAAVLWSVLR